MTPMQLAQVIDHTLLKPEATARQIATLCAEAREHRFYSVCVNPYWVSLAAGELRGGAVRVCAVAGFPLGASVAAAKAFEAERAVRDGAAEVDMVLNVGRLIDSALDEVEREIAEVRAAIGADALLKVIIEAGLLSDAQKAQAARLVVAAGADFVKTSTGFSPAGGATLADVRLLRSVVGRQAKVKAAGGIRDLSTALAMLEAGADRLGASASVAIVTAAAAAARDAAGGEAG